MSWLAVAAVTLALGMRGTAPPPVTEVAVKPASLESASPQAHAAKNIEDLRVGHAGDGEPEYW